MRASDEPIFVEQTFHIPLDTVWRAITQPDLMRRWYFDSIADFKPEVGFETRFTVSNDGRDFPQDVPEFRRESGLAGWQYFVQRSLKEHLDGTPRE